MAAQSNPVLSAGSVTSYSSNSGSAYTAFGTEVKNVEPDGRARKVIERLLLGTTFVDKRVARRNFGKLKVTLEYSSSLWAILVAFDDAPTTPIWIKSVLDDSGGTNGSTHVYKGYVSSLMCPKTPGDDEILEIIMELELYGYTFNAGA